MLISLMRQEKARAVLIPASTHRSFSDGNVPGVEQSKSETEELIGSAKLLRAPLNSLDSLAI